MANIYDNPFSRNMRQLMSFRKMTNRNNSSQNSQIEIYKDSIDLLKSEEELKQKKISTAKSAIALKYSEETEKNKLRKSKLDNQKLEQEIDEQIYTNIEKANSLFSDTINQYTSSTLEKIKFDATEINKQGERTFKSDHHRQSYEAIELELNSNANNTTSLVSNNVSKMVSNGANPAQVSEYFGQVIEYLDIEYSSIESDIVQKRIVEGLLNEEGMPIETNKYLDVSLDSLYESNNFEKNEEETNIVSIDVFNGREDEAKKYLAQNYRDSGIDGLNIATKEIVEKLANGDGASEASLYNEISNIRKEAIQEVDNRLMAKLEFAHQSKEYQNGRFIVEGLMNDNMFTGEIKYDSNDPIKFKDKKNDYENILYAGISEVNNLNTIADIEEDDISDLIIPKKDPNEEKIRIQLLNDIVLNGLNAVYGNPDITFTNNGGKRMMLQVVDRVRKQLEQVYKQEEVYSLDVFNKEKERDGSYLGEVNDFIKNNLDIKIVSSNNSKINIEEFSIAGEGETVSGNSSITNDMISLYSRNYNNGKISDGIIVTGDHRYDILARISAANNSGNTIINGESVYVDDPRNLTQKQIDTHDQANRLINEIISSESPTSTSGFKLTVENLEQVDNAIKSLAISGATNLAYDLTNKALSLKSDESESFIVGIYQESKSLEQIQNDLFDQDSIKKFKETGNYDDLKFINNINPDNAINIYIEHIKADDDSETSLGKEYKELDNIAKSVVKGDTTITDTRFKKELFDSLNSRVENKNKIDLLLNIVPEDKIRALTKTIKDNNFEFDKDQVKELNEYSNDYVRKNISRFNRKKDYLLQEYNTRRSSNFINFIDGMVQDFNESEFDINKDSEELNGISSLIEGNFPYEDILDFIEEDGFRFFDNSVEIFNVNLSYNQTKKLSDYLQNNINNIEVYNSTSGNSIKIVKKR